MNNVVRVAMQALAAVLGGTQSLHTNGYDEALALPTAEAAALALRTQQVLAEETGVADWADPFGGSYLVEHLTNRIESEVLELMDRIEERGGASGAIELMQEAIHRSAYGYQLEVEAGKRVIVGVNRYETDHAHDPPPGPDFRELEARQTASLKAFKAARDRGGIAGHLQALTSAADSDANVLPVMIEAVKGGVTLGEISDALRRLWGTYDAPV